ncbi:MAG: rhomboid family intramembrane serine protease [Planctomycetota bacterium]|jgi:membrane associated rhomboid family serine protease
MQREESRPSRLERLKGRICLVVAFVALLWVIQLVNQAMSLRLSEWGIRPRTAGGLPGIIFAPFLHGGINHLILNTVPLLVLGSLVILRGTAAFLSASCVIIVLGGAGVWIFGRPSVHIGASSLIFGYFGYLLARGWYGRDFLSILLAILTVVLYGGLLFGILPLKTHISWEGHLFGLLAGLLDGRLQSRDKKPAGKSS